MVNTPTIMDSGICVSLEVDQVTVAHVENFFHAGCQRSQSQGSGYPWKKNNTYRQDVILWLFFLTDHCFQRQYSLSSS